jgi:hypothetical protein
MNVRRGLVIAVVLIGIVAAVYLGLFTTHAVRKPVSYWVVDDHTLGVLVLDAPSIKCEVTDVDETSREIRIVANCAEPLLSTGSAGAAHRNEFQITLDGPLANRAVIDAFGHPADRCSTLRCEGATPA